MAQIKTEMETNPNTTKVALCVLSSTKRINTIKAQKNIASMRTKASNYVVACAQELKIRLDRTEIIYAACEVLHAIETQNV